MTTTEICVSNRIDYCMYEYLHTLDTGLVNTCVSKNSFFVCISTPHTQA